MKKATLYLLLFFMAFATSKAQPPARGTVKFRPELDKFTGTWQWINANDTIIIQLKKVHYYYDDMDLHEDILMGTHKYIKNGVVIEDYSNRFNGVGQTKSGTVGFSVNWHYPDTTNLTEGTIRDGLKKISHYIDISYINTTPPQLKCHVYVKGGIILPPSTPGVTLPTEELYLTKQ